MIDLGREFDKYAKVVSPTRKCDLCDVEYYFLKPYNKEGKHRNYCDVCHQAVSSGAVSMTTTDVTNIGGNKRPAPPRKLPLVMMIFAGLGGVMMILGLGFTMLSTGDDANIMNIMFGAATTALGFVLLRKTLKSRSLLLGSKNPMP